MLYIKLNFKNLDIFIKLKKFFRNKNHFLIYKIKKLFFLYIKNMFNILF